MRIKRSSSAAVSETSRARPRVTRGEFGLFVVSVGLFALYTWLQLWAERGLLALVAPAASLGLVPLAIYRRQKRLGG